MDPIMMSLRKRKKCSRFVLHELLGYHFNQDRSFNQSFISCGMKRMEKNVL